MHPNPHGSSWTRRQWLVAAGAGLTLRAGVAAPASRVAVARCAAYDASVLSSLRTMFDGIGGIGNLVAGKTVAVKINMSGQMRARNGNTPAWYTHWTHPVVIAAAVQLIGRAGAKKIRILEGSYEDDNPLEENILQGGWDPRAILSAASNVEMENTDGLGSAREYKTLQVSGGGLIYPAFDCNHSYSECDVMVSIAKLKEHQTAGVALSMNNMIGITPATIYGDAAGFENPAERPYGGRGMFHTGRRQPSPPSPPEKDTASPRDAGYRIPRITIDILRARPVDLAIIDGIQVQTAFEGAIPPPGFARRIRPVTPGVLVAGLNPLCTDAVAAALMGFDPMADRGKPPFENCDSTLKIAEEAGIGTRDMSKIEIAGPSLKTLQFTFRS